MTYKTDDDGELTVLLCPFFVHLYPLKQIVLPCFKLPHDKVKLCLAFLVSLDLVVKAIQRNF